MATLPFEIIVAIDSTRGIGKEGVLPWHLSGDLKHFKEITTSTSSPSKKNTVIMGRKTWESIPHQFRPLSRRINIVLTRQKDVSFPEGVLKFDSLESALGVLSGDEFKERVEKIFVIGGAQIFQKAVSHESCLKIHLTQILEKFNCDTFFPEFKEQFHQIHSTPSSIEGKAEYYFATFQRSL